MNANGQWDCANARCSRYHELFRRPFIAHTSSPRCPRCHQPLRLVRVIRSMDPAVKRLLEARRKPVDV